MSIAALVKTLLAAGVEHDVIVAAVEAVETRPVDAQAERRRAADRERKRVKGGIPQNSADSAETPSPLVPPPLSPEPPNSPPYNPPNPSISVHRKRSTHSEFFDRFWAAYPRREGSNPKHPAAKAFARAVSAGADPETIILGAQHYRSEQLGKDARFIPQARTWLNEARWEDSAPRLTIVPTATSPPRQRLTPEEVEAQVRAFGIIK